MLHLFYIYFLLIFSELSANSIKILDTETKEEVLKIFGIDKDFKSNFKLNKEIVRQQLSFDYRINSYRKKNRMSTINKIENIIHKHKNTPKELLFVAMNESNFNPDSLSRTGAKGIWQFMPATAKDFNLTVNSKLDERTDTVKSTKKALKYLKYLNNIFDNWALSIMSYNCGQGRLVQDLFRIYIDYNSKNKLTYKYKTILKKYKRKEITFSTLVKKYKEMVIELETPSFSHMLNEPYIPLETKNYIRRIVASSVVFNDYNFKWIYISDQF